MANFSNLKSVVQSIIKQNGNQEITGDLLQGVLISMIAQVGAHATLVGLATPDTNPGVNDGPVFYIAKEAGTYTFFDGVVITNFSFLYTQGGDSGWNVIQMDEIPIASDSVNGLLTALQKRALDSFDITFNEQCELLFTDLATGNEKSVQVPIAGQENNGIITSDQKYALDHFSIDVTESSADERLLLTYTDLDNGSEQSVEIPTATTSKNGAMSAGDKAKLDTLSPKESFFIDLWNNVCSNNGRYNADTGYYELNGITDLTYNQALLIYQATSNMYINTDMASMFEYSFCKTTIPIHQNRANIILGSVERIDFRNAFQNSVVQVLNLGTQINVSKASNAFKMCMALKEIKTMINVSGVSDEDLANMFQTCISLETVYIMGLTSSIAINSSSKLNYDSLRSLVDDAENTSAITVKVQSQTYNYLTGTATPPASVGGTADQWKQIVTDATAKQISFAR